MNRIITTDILDPTIQQPFTGRSLDFLQDANKSMVAEICKMRIGSGYSASVAYVMRGLVPYGTNQYTAGSVFFNGELYECAGKSTTTAFSNVPVLTITIADDATADPVIFTDSVSRSVHKKRTMVLSDAVSGSGTSDLSACLYINTWMSYTPTFTAYDSSDVVVGGGATLSSVVAQYLFSDQNLRISLNAGDVDILATVRYITISLPFALPTGTTASGSGAVDMPKTGAASISAIIAGTQTAAGAGSINLTTLNGSDFGAISNYTLKSFINLAVY